MLESNVGEGSIFIVYIFNFLNGLYDIQLFNLEVVVMIEDVIFVKVVEEIIVIIEINNVF